MGNKKNTDILEDIESIRSGMVHLILSHSYLVFLLAVVLGAVFDQFILVNIFSYTAFAYIGFAFIMLGSLLIYWAQITSDCVKRELRKGASVSSKTFSRGPYKYSRSPTHNGLSIMTLGLGLVLNSFFIFIFVFVATILTKLVFLKKEEILLEKKYGDAYCDYKKKLKNWI